MAIMAALSVQYSKAGRNAVELVFWASWATPFRRPELALTPPAIQNS